MKKHILTMGGVLAIAVGILLAAFGAWKHRAQREESVPEPPATIERSEEPAPLNIPLLAQRAASANPAVRAPAEYELRTLRDKDLPSLVRAGSQLSLTLADVVAHILAEVGVPILDRIEEIIRVEDNVVLWIPQYCVRAIGPPALPHLAKYAASPNAQVRLWVASCMAYFPTDPKTAGPILAGLVADVNEKVAVKALQAAAIFGPKLQPWAARIRAAANDPRPAVQLAAAAVLPGLATKNDDLAGLLKAALAEDNSVEKRVGIIRGLTLWMATPDILKTLDECLRSKEPRIQQAALDTLATRGQPAAAYVKPTLLTLLRGETVPSPPKILDILSYCSPPPKEVAPIAVRYLKSNQSEEKIAAINFLGKVPELQESVIEQVLRTAQDRNQSVRVSVIQFTKHFPNRPDAVAVLREASAKDPAPFVRNLASRVLAQRDKKGSESGGKR